jgi:hypothetical protein
MVLNQPVNYEHFTKNEIKNRFMVVSKEDLLNIGSNAISSDSGRNLPRASRWRRNGVLRHGGQRELEQSRSP